jgi:cadmium resistance protein CadD (predicted permease)
LVKLLDYYKNKKVIFILYLLKRYTNSSKNKFSIQIPCYHLSIAAVTFSNSGDNIGIFTPLFASYYAIGQIVILVVILIIMTAVWCSVGYYFANHSLLVHSVCHSGHSILPLVLIGLGIYIMRGDLQNNLREIILCLIYFIN